MWIFLHVIVIGDVVRLQRCSQATSPLLASLLSALCFTVSRCAAPQHPATFCDNGKMFLDRDLPIDSSFWDCAAPQQVEHSQTLASIDKMYDLEPARRVCMETPISYNHSIPNSGAFRPVKAESGEYLYCPPQRWLNNLHLGAIVLLHHPCAPLRERHLLSGLAHSCLPSFIISSNPLLSRHTPLALVTWGRSLELTSVSSVICDWLDSAHGKINPSDEDQIMMYNYLLVRAGDLQRQEASTMKKVTLRRCCEETISSLLRGIQKKEQKGSKKRQKRAAIRKKEHKMPDVLDVSKNQTLQNHTNSIRADSHEQTGSSHISTNYKVFTDALKPVQQKVVKSADHGKMKGNEVVNVEEREVEHSTSHLHHKEGNTQLDQVSKPQSGSHTNPEQVVHGDGSIHSTGHRGLPRTPRSDEAVWAAAALGFLLILLTLSILHTRLYRHCRTSPGIYWHDPQRDYDSVADVIRRRLKIANRRRKRGRRQECVLLPSSSSSDELP